MANGSDREAGLGEAASSSWCPGRSATPSLKAASSSRRSPASRRRRDGLAATLKAFTANGSKVLVLRDTPRPGFDVPECVSAAGKDLTKCASARAKAFIPASTGVEQAAAELTKGATYVDLDNAVCPSDPCPPIIGNVLVYRDTDHMTATYAATLEPAVADGRGLPPSSRLLEDAADRAVVGLAAIGGVLQLPGRQAVGVHRLRVEEALAEVAAESPQPLAYGVVLDALGDDLQPEVVGQVDHRRDDGSVAAGRRGCRATNDWSIFTCWIGRLLRYVSDE